jgi:predicted nucleotidyltransferase component of viral defense system
MQKYHEQVRLLVAVLPHIAKENCFALKGGTAINMFVRDMPRLSVDIDLQYINFDDRETAFANINNALVRIVNSLKVAGINAIIRKDTDNICKIICSDDIASVKIEPNYVIRGCIATPQLMQNVSQIQELYGFAAIKILSFGELYGGKICAALDRQHPRDLFDVGYLLNNEGITHDVKNGFIVSLLSHNRPPHEILKPNIQNQEMVFIREFSGMTKDSFFYKDHLNTMNCLINRLNAAFSDRDKEFLIGFFSANPSWNLIDIDKLNELPAIKWKMKNLELLREKDKKKYDAQIDSLQNKLF